MSNLDLSTLYFHTSNTDNTQSDNLGSAVILEHNGTDYIRHSQLQDFDFTNDFLGKRSVGEGSDVLTFNEPFKFTQQVMFADIQAVLYRDADGDIIEIGSGNTAAGLTEAQVQQLIRESSITDLMDTPNELGDAGQILVVNSDGDATEWIDQPTGGGPAGTATHPILVQRDYDSTALQNAADESINDNTGLWVKVNAGGVGIPEANFRDLTGGGAPPPNSNNVIVLPSGSQLRIFDGDDVRLTFVPNEDNLIWARTTDALPRTLSRYNVKRIQFRRIYRVRFETEGKSYQN